MLRQFYETQMMLGALAPSVGKFMKCRFLLVQFKE